MPDDDEQLSAIQKVVRAAEAIRVQISNIRAAVDHAEAGELPGADRRHLLETIASLGDEAEALLEWATSPARKPTVN